MRFDSRRLVSAALLVAAGAVLAVELAPRDAESAPAPVGSPKTHFGVAAADIVVLQLSGTAASRRFVRVRSDGAVEPNWHAPAGAALFVTDVEWAAGWQNPSQGPFERTLRLQAVNDATPSQRGTVMYVSPLSGESLETPAKLYGGGAARAQVGFTLAPTAHLEVDAPSTLDADGNPQPGPWFGDVIVRGYLVKSK